MKERVVGRRGGRGARFCLYEALTGDLESFRLARRLTFDTAAANGSHETYRERKTGAGSMSS